MPLTIMKLPNQNKYKVINKITKKVHAYNTTYTKAFKRIRSIRMLVAQKNSKKLVTFFFKISSFIIYGDCTRITGITK